ncbi:hypothetical protein OE749_18120 [Aestuariibacter sp. AA17]|uniref:Anti-sigma factor n=1 Tax=Fluctibacter corallii TaxID=2984329 RepID=A0ABT3AD88_9ALTE|nr:hypothetical protein [Aestuariibacter sp. AA17]MCV2886615.1 hypothetical protein [Aestuariibacter sp. AA17]
MSNQDFERQLASQIAQLDKQKQPERDLWQGIELSLAKDQAEPQPRKQAGNTVILRQTSTWVAMAATFAFVGVLSWFTLNQPAPQSSPDMMDVAMTLSQQHEAQKQALLVRFEDQPALTQNWQQQLAELDEAAKAIKAALAQDPNNIALLKMLQHVHQQQIDLIETVHAPKWQQI